MAKGGKGTTEGEPKGNDPAVFAKNYSLMCKCFGIKTHEGINEILHGDETPDHVTVDADLGPLGARALVEAMLGTHEALGTAGGYQLINTIRLWRSNLGDEGVRAIADYVALSPKKKLDAGYPDLTYLQLMDCGVSAKGALYLGKALQVGANATLLTLNLDHNDDFGAAGLRNLAEGLCTNKTLKRLSVAYCDIQPEGGRSLKNILSGSKSALEELNLKGNRIGGSGLKAFCKVLSQNTSLKSLDISTNDIGPDTEALGALADALNVNATLAELRLQENSIGEAGATVLVESGTFDKTNNTTLKEFTVDVTLPIDLFEKLLRAGGGGGKKGGKKKKKGK